MKKKFLKFSIYFILLCLFVIMTGSNIFAHKVIIFAYLGGDTVYTESYFSDGKKVKDGEIIVYDSQGNKLLEGKTDKDGLFNFKLPKKDDLKIILNATMGHKNSYILSASEIPDIPEKSSYIPTYLPPSRGRIEEGGRVNVCQADLTKYLGVPKFTFSVSEREDKIGVATGLAWTEYGGDMLFTEVLAMKGKGNLLITGKLGEVMKESAQAAFSYVRAHSDQLKIEKDFPKKFDLHIHVPEGAIPKDGPSAGITIAAALVSCLTKKPLRGDTAMTGEITLRGKVLPIGGLKNKLLAAQRGEIKRVILPKENEKDLSEIDQKIKENLEFIFVENVDEALKEALK